MAKTKDIATDDATAISVPSEPLTEAQKFKAAIRAKIVADALEASTPKPIPEWTDADANEYGTTDPVVGSALKRRHAERQEELAEVAKLADGCCHVKTTGEKVFPSGLKAFLLAQGFSVSAAKSACDHFAEHGFWKHREFLFGVEPGSKF